MLYILRPWLWNLGTHLNYLEVLLNYGLLDSPLRLPDSVDFGGGPRICTSDTPPDNADTAGSETIH